MSDSMAGPGLPATEHEASATPEAAPAEAAVPTPGTVAPEQTAAAADHGPGPADHDPAAPAPLGVDRTPTGHAEVDDRLRRLADADHLPTDGHIEVYEDVHRGLRDELTALDTRPGPPGHPGPPAPPNPSPTPTPSPTVYDNRS